MEHHQSDVLESYRLEIKTLEQQRELFNGQVDSLIAQKKQIVHNLLTTPLPYVSIQTDVPDSKGKDGR